MTNAQFYVALAIPFFTILVVWIGSTVANRHAINDLRAEMATLGTSIRAEITTQGASIRAEMKAGFDAVNHRLSRLETMGERIDDEIRVGHEHRLTVLEEKVLSRAS